MHFLGTLYFVVQNVWTLVEKLFCIVVMFDEVLLRKQQTLTQGRCMLGFRHCIQLSRWPGLLVLNVHCEGGSQPCPHTRHTHQLGSCSREEGPSRSNLDQSSSAQIGDPREIDHRETAVFNGVQPYRFQQQEGRVTLCRFLILLNVHHACWSLVLEWSQVTDYVHHHALGSELPRNFANLALVTKSSLIMWSRARLAGLLSPNHQQTNWQD